MKKPKFINKECNANMSKGKRYSSEKKLNVKKVFAVIIVLIVIVMFCVVIAKLLNTERKEITKEFSKGYFTVYADDAWGVINEKGEYVIQPTYSELIVIPDSSKDIFLCVDNVNYETGTYISRAIDASGQAKFTEYESVEAIENYDESYNMWYEKGVLKVKNGDKYGLIDLDGKVLLNCEYDSIESIKGITNSILIKKDDKFGLCDNTGNIIIPNEYAEIKALTDQYSDGYIVKNSDGLYGVIDCNKQIVVDVKYQDIDNVYGNNTYVVKENNEWKLIKEDEEIALQGWADEIISIDANNIIIKKDNKYGVSNNFKDELIKTEYDSLTYIFTDHYIAKQGDKYGVISINGETPIPIENDLVTYNKEADFIVAQINDEEKVYDRNFEYKFSGIVTEVNTSKDYILAYVDGEYKYYNFKFEERENTKLLYENTLFLKKENGKYGYVNKDGVVVVNYIYDDAKEQNAYGYAAVKKDGVWGCIDQNGNVVVTPKINMDENIVINFIGRWHLSEDVNANYYVQ